MENIKLKLRKRNTKDFGIIYKGYDGIIEIQASKEKLFKSLNYFQTRSKEINSVNEYFIHDEFKTEIFRSFIDSVEKDEISINEDNYSDYYKLSCKYDFMELREEIENFIQNRPDIKLIIENLPQTNQKAKEESNDTDDNLNVDPAKEELIAQNLDFSLQNDLLKKLPLSIVNRILNSPKRKLNNHHLLFKFVLEQISNYKKEIKENVQVSPSYGENIKIMSSTLDYCEMSEEDIEEFFLVSSDLDVFEPKNSKKVMKNLIHDLKIQHKRIDELEKKMNSFLASEKEKENKFQEKIVKIEEKLSNCSKEEANKLQKVEERINETVNKRKDNENKINDLKNQINNIKQSITDDKNKIEQELKKLKEEIQNNGQKLFVSKDQLRKVLQAGREKTRSLVFWVENKTWTNPEGNWSSGPVTMGDGNVCWINNQRNLRWEAFQPWDAAISSIQNQ